MESQQDMKFKIFVVSVFSTALAVMSLPAIAQSASHTVSGRIQVIDGYYGQPGEPCNQYRRGYQDIMQGTSITVKDGNGNVIAVVETPSGINEDTGIETNSTESFVICVVTIPAFEVPNSEFYIFDFGSRGEITKSRQQMEEDNWQLQMSIGGN